MTKEKRFILDSIKMDLHGVATASGAITKELPKESIISFLDHADSDFDKTALDDREKSIKNELRGLKKEIDSLSDSKKRLIWTEDVMTARCRL